MDPKRRQFVDARTCKSPVAEGVYADVQLSPDVRLSDVFSMSDSVPMSVTDGHGMMQLPFTITPTIEADTVSLSETEAETATGISPAPTTIATATTTAATSMAISFPETTTTTTTMLLDAVAVASPTEAAAPSVDDHLCLDFCSSSDQCNDTGSVFSNYQDCGDFISNSSNNSGDLCDNSDGNIGMNADNINFNSSSNNNNLTNSTTTTTTTSATLICSDNNINNNCSSNFNNNNDNNNNHSSNNVNNSNSNGGANDICNHNADQPQSQLNNQDAALLISGRQDFPVVMRRVGDYELALGKHLGRGAFSHVYEGVHVVTGERVAVKVCFRKDSSANVNELRINRLAAGHPHIVPLKSHFVINDAVYMFFELCAGGELFHQIVPCVGLRPREMVGPYFAQLVDAVDFLHSQGIAHLDIKTENIFLDMQGALKLGDFGLSTMVEDGPVFGCRGSLSYAAPENLTSNKAQSACGRGGYDGLKADMWSLGIVLYVLLYGCTPWGSAQDANTDFRNYRISYGCPNSKPWLTMASPFRTLFQRVLNVCPSRRWTCAQLKEYISRTFGWRAVLSPSLARARDAAVARLAAHGNSGVAAAAAAAAVGAAESSATHDGMTAATAASSASLSSSSSPPPPKRDARGGS